MPATPPAPRPWIGTASAAHRMACAFDATSSTSEPSGAGNAAVTDSPGLSFIAGFPEGVSTTSEISRRFTEAPEDTSIRGGGLSTVAGATRHSGCSPLSSLASSETAVPPPATRHLLDRVGGMSNTRAFEVTRYDGRVSGRGHTLAKHVVATEGRLLRDRPGGSTPSIPLIDSATTHGSSVRFARSSSATSARVTS